MYFQCSISAHQLLPKQFVFTLTVGFTFGFSIAYMALSGSGLGGRKEMFQGPPPYPEDPHSHDHKVQLTVYMTLSQHPQMFSKDRCTTWTLRLGLR